MGQARWAELRRLGDGKVLLLPAAQAIRVHGCKGGRDLDNQRSIDRIDCYNPQQRQTNRHCDSFAYLNQFN